MSLSAAARAARIVRSETSCGPMHGCPTRSQDNGAISVCCRSATHGSNRWGLRELGAKRADVQPGASGYSDGDEVIESGIVSVKRGELRVMRGSPVFIAEGQKPTRTMYPDEGQRITNGAARRIRLALATGLIAWGLLSSAAVHADHLSPKHDPWAQPWELERMASYGGSGRDGRCAGRTVLDGQRPRGTSGRWASGIPTASRRPRRLWIDRYEVSNVDYLRFVLGTGTDWPTSGGRTVSRKRRLHPVIGVTG